VAFLRLRLRGRGGTNDTQVAATANLDTLADRLRRGGSSRPRGLARLSHRTRLGRGGPVRASYVADDVRERLEVIGALLRGVGRQPHHVPPARHHEPRGVHLAQVPRMRVDVPRERAENGRGVLVHVRERVDGRLLARGT